MSDGMKGFGMVKRLMYYALYVVVCEVGNCSASQAQQPPPLSFQRGILSGPAWALYGNPASLALTQGLIAGTVYENHYSIKDLRQAGFYCQSGRKTYGMGLFYDNSGPSFYRSQELGIAYGQRIGMHMMAGLKLAYRRLVVSDVGARTSSLSFDLGIRARLSSKLIFSGVLEDPYTYRFQNGNQEMAAYKAGIQYQADPAWSLSLEIDKLPEFKPSLVFAAGFSPSSWTTAWIRNFTGPWGLEMGWGIRSGGLDFYAYADYHAILGFSPGVMLCFMVTKPK